MFAIFATHFLAFLLGVATYALFSARNSARADKINAALSAAIAVAAKDVKLNP